MAFLSIRVTPRSAKPGIGDWKSDPEGRLYLTVRVASAPSDGAANDELVRLLSRALGLPRSSLRIASGQSSRLKRIELPLETTEIRERLGQGPGGSEGGQIPTKSGRPA